MKSRMIALLFIAHSAVPAYAQPAGPAPKGEVTKYTFTSSKIFPGTVRDYWVYVPQQYDPAKPACVHVNQDGIQFNAPAVFDELIHKKEMPVTIGVFVMPGRAKAPHDNTLDRNIRSYEYDGLGDNYVRFLLDELLPDVETKKTSDGRPIKLSKSGNDRSIGGSSSGAFCAFTAAWERPDAFSRVFSAMGTYVGMRDGNNYPTLIRKYEPKPIRVFLQDGSNKLDIYVGDWWMMANQEMERALKTAGYEVNHSWDTGGKDSKHATKIFPEAMKWLWKDWPTEVKAAGTKEMKEILKEGEGWKLVMEVDENFVRAVSNKRGEVFCSAIGSGWQRIYKVGLDLKGSRFQQDGIRVLLWAFGPDGQSYFGGQATRFYALGENGQKTELINPVSCVDMIVDYKGGVYVVDTSGAKAAPRLFYFQADGKSKGGMKPGDWPSPPRIALSPDQTLLYASLAYSNWIYSYEIGGEGKFKNGQKYCHLHVPDTADNSGASCMCVDRDGRLYVSTRMGIQICDQTGRVNCILPVPIGQPTGLCFGGANFDTLFVTCGDKIYSRKLKTRGANAFEPPIKPAPPRVP